MSSFFAGDLAGDADRQTRPGKRVTADEPFGQAKLAAQGAHLVLEQFAQRLDQSQFHALGQAADIVMRFDRDRGAADGARRLDHIGIERSLGEKLDIAQFLRLLVEHVDKDGADPLALFFGIGDAGELGQKQIAGIAMNERDVVVTAEQVDDLFGLAGAQQAGIDKDAGQLVADRLVQ